MNDNQRVSIQYSIGMDELPQEVSRLLNKTKTQLKELEEKDLAQLADVPVSSLLSLNTLTDVALARKKLAMIDHIFSDVENIINGFVSYRVQETAPAENETQQRVETPADTVADIPPFDPKSQMAPPAHHPGMPSAPGGMGGMGGMGMPPGFNAASLSEAMSNLGNMDMDDFKAKMKIMQEARDARADELPDNIREK